MRGKSPFLKALSERSLLALLVFSFICTLLGFGIAYTEHRSLTDLSDKYDVAIEKIDQCQAALSSLSELVTSTQYIQSANTEEYLSTSDFYQISDIIADTSANGKADNSTAQTKPAKTTRAPEISGQYYVTQSGSKYHISSCSYLSKSRIAVSLETIRSKGYSPCSRCIK
jgi:hypothetical protein